MASHIRGARHAVVAKVRWPGPCATVAALVEQGKQVAENPCSAGACGWHQARDHLCCRQCQAMQPHHAAAPCAGLHGAVGTRAGVMPPASPQPYMQPDHVQAGPRTANTPTTTAAIDMATSRAPPAVMACRCPARPASTPPAPSRPSLSAARRPAQRTRARPG